MLGCHLTVGLCKGVFFRGMPKSIFVKEYVRKAVVFFVGVECFLFSFSDCMTRTVGMNASKVGEWWATQGSGLAVLGLDN